MKQKSNTTKTAQAAYTFLELLLILAIIGLLATLGIRLLGKHSSFENSTNAVQAYLQYVVAESSAQPDRTFYLLVGNSDISDDRLDELVLVESVDGSYLILDEMMEINHDIQIISPSSSAEQIPEHSHFSDSKAPQPFPEIPGNWYTIPFKAGLPENSSFQLVLTPLPFHPTPYHSNVRVLRISNYRTVTIENL